MIYFEGFNGGNGGMPAYLERHGHTAHAGLNTDTGRISGISLEIGGGEYWVIPVTMGASFTIGFAFNPGVWLLGPDKDFLFLRIGTTDQITLSLMAGEIGVKTEADTVTTTDFRGKNNIWIYIEFQFTIHDSNGSYILKINGKEQLNRTGIDTYNAGTTGIDNFRFYGGTYLIDDLYINNNFLGDCRVDSINPDGNGFVNDWTPLVGSNYEEVDDGDTVDDDTTYVESNSTMDQDLYTYSDLSILGTIHAVQLNTICRKTVSSGFYIEQLVRTGTIIYDETPIAVAGETYEAITRVMTIDPSTLSAWAVSNINAAQFGFEVTT